LSTALKYSLFLPLANELFKNSITPHTLVYKNWPLLFFGIAAWNIGRF